MKKEETDLIHRCGKRNAFKVPEGYFEDFAGQLMDKLPEKTPAEVPTVSMWARIKPWIYMTAMFCGIMLMVRTFVGEKEDDSAILSGISLSEMPDEYIDPLVNESMMDDYTLYMYLTEAEPQIYPNE
ncbi:MAG TPA: hypothetical protein H9752_05705 [Candidatus Phocaeicola excrementigallinarum]|nr:hypothetical protein [Candidatus Phocaeicola excrementigallinarum]